MEHAKGEARGRLVAVHPKSRPVDRIGTWRRLSPLVSLVASAALAALGYMLGSFMTQWSVILPALDITLSFAMTTLLFAMIYKYVPREKLAWSDVWIGAVVTALLFTIGKFLIGIYLGQSAFNWAYGAAGSIVVLLMWIYYSTQIFLLGAEFTRVVTFEYGSRRRPLVPM